MSLDDRVAWGYYEFSEDLFNHETVEEWIPLTGKQGDEKEGNVNVILSLSVSPVELHFTKSSNNVIIAYNVYVKVFTILVYNYNCVRFDDMKYIVASLLFKHVLVIMRLTYS